MAATPAPRGQVAIPPEIFAQLNDVYKLKGGLSAFCKRAGVKSDTVRLAMKRGTTTERTLKRVANALERAGFLPVLSVKGRTDVSRAGASNGHAESTVEQIDQFPPAVLRQIQRVSGALIDGMQLMQLTLLKVMQEELADLHGMPPRHTKHRAGGA